MKKVLVLAAALCLLATPALAGIRNSAHDLSSSSTNTRIKTNKAGFDRLCVFCHTPHAANISTPGPLWNRTSNYAFAAGLALYTSATIEAATVAVDAAAMNATDAPLCMGCHDGALGDVLENAPNIGVAAPTAAEFANLPMTTTANLVSEGTPTFANDHPIGFNYTTVQGQEALGDNQLNTLAVATGKGVKFYGAAKDMMWCSSCHDVHTPGTTTDGQAPFLITSNDGSALCLACHNK